jgi:heme/copper-type cytochrome/quinol oxidase subunit 2
MKRVKGKVLEMILNNRYKESEIRLSLQSRLYKFTHQTFLETIWTIIPVIIVVAIAIPSFLLLYAIDVTVDTALTIKAIGHQWYWSFEQEYPILSEDLTLLFKRRIFDSYMIVDNELLVGQLRNLEVDHSLLLPIKTHLDLIVTADDVLHSFALPSAGIKIDAIPGRLNHTGVFLERAGILYGQCSELCGTNHGFMPIKAVALNYSSYVYMNDKNINI